MKLRGGELTEKVKVTFMQKRRKGEIEVMAVVRKKSKSKPRKIKYLLIAWALIAMRRKYKELG